MDSGFMSSGFEDYHHPLPMLPPEDMKKLTDNVDVIWNNMIKNLPKLNEMENVTQQGDCKIAQSRFSELSSQVVNFLLDEAPATRNDFMHEIAEAIKNNLRERHDVALAGQLTAQGESDQFSETLVSISGGNR